ncbi:MAG: hypothetical protein COA52_03385 [Hyphomicrobiales bacterium]|nr:DUF2834 domain-containing protein [Hyphomicrobiales bacterium]PCJ95677.1 MAG: hypothetical protein COA52_03385 [Hyphomicrobiales bacterium]
MKNFYLLMAVLGTIIPYIFFGSFIADNGINLIAFVKALFVNGAAGGFSADILLSSFVFWVWSFHDARQQGIARWWLIIPANLLVGLSLALPLYFYMREGKKSA